MRKLICIASCLLLTACVTKLLYQRLDWFIGWRLHDYVTLTDAQNARFKGTFAALWAWHRERELPRYAGDLREIAAKIDSRVTLTPDQIGAYTARFQTHWEELMSHTVDAMCDIARTLSDAQVRDILEGVDEKTAEFARDYVAPPEDELRKKAQKRTKKWITRWTGPLNSAQEIMLNDWAARRHAMGKAWLEQRKAWREQFAAALKERAASPNCNAFRPLFVTPMAQLDASVSGDFDYNQQQWNHLVAEILAGADDRQLKRASSELREMAQQFDELAVAGKGG